MRFVVIDFADISTEGKIWKSCAQFLLRICGDIRFPCTGVVLVWGNNIHSSSYIAEYSNVFSSFGWSMFLKSSAPNHW